LVAHLNNFYNKFYSNDLYFVLCLIIFLSTLNLPSTKMIESNICDATISELDRLWGIFAFPAFIGFFVTVPTILLIFKKSDNFKVTYIPSKLDAAWQ